MKSEEIKEKLEEFNIRWDNIEDTDYSTEFNNFKTRIYNLIKQKENSFKEIYIQKYFQIWGLKYNFSWYKNTNIDNIMLPDIIDEKIEKQFYKKIQTLFYLTEDIQNKYDRDTVTYLGDMYRSVVDILQISKVNLANN